MTECRCVAGYNKELVHSKRNFKNINELTRYLRLNKKFHDCQKHQECKKRDTPKWNKY